MKSLRRWELKNLEEFRYISLLDKWERSWREKASQVYISRLWRARKYIGIHIITTTIIRIRQFHNKMAQTYFWNNFLRANVSFDTRWNWKGIFLSNIFKLRDETWVLWDYTYAAQMLHINSRNIRTLRY